jgi:hypothetical protein
MCEVAWEVFESLCGGRARGLILPINIIHSQRRVFRQKCAIIDGNSSFTQLENGWFAPTAPASCYYSKTSN